jgi:hypothetical protein
MNLKISATELKNNFIDSFKNEKSFKYDDGNPFLITFESKEYYVFLKNISPAYYPKYPDITRIQLPYSPHFRKISKSNIPFIILGFNVDYGTFTGWDPSKIKVRLNNKSNVSLFSRDSFQEKLRMNDFREQHISNGDKVIVFSIKSIPLYFRNYNDLFKNNLDEVKVRFVKKRHLSNIDSKTSKGSLSKIEDVKVLKIVSKFKEKNDLIGAVLYCAEYYKDIYPNVPLNRWTKLVNNIFSNKEIFLVK